MKTKDLLENIGLTGSEIKVYLALLELGSTTKGPIVKKAGVASSKIYQLLDKLSKKGLVSTVVKSNVKHFEAAPPDRILDFIRKKKERIENQEKEMKKILPALKEKRSTKGMESETQVFKGKKGAKTAVKDIIKTLDKGEELYVLGNSSPSPGFARFILDFQKERSDKGIKAKTLLNETAKELYGKKLEKLPKTNIKYVQKRLFMPFALLMYKNKTLVSLPEENVYIQIKSKNLADGLRSYFDYVWNNDVKVYKGFEDVMNKFNKMLEELKPNETYYVLGASHGFLSDKLEDWFLDFHKRRVEKNVKVKLLYVPKIRKYVKRDMRSTDPEMKLSKVKELPQKFQAPMQINLYKENKVLMFLWSKDITCFEIESKVLYNHFKSYFDGLWKQKMRTYEGRKSVENAFTDVADKLTKEDEIVVFASKPKTKRSSDFNIKWLNNLKSKVKDIRLIYYGNTEENKKRARKFEDIGCKTKIIPTKQTLPISKIVAGDFVLNAIWGKRPSVFKTENKTIANSLKNNFELLWEEKSKTIKGDKGIKNCFKNLVEEMNKGEEVKIMGVHDFGKDFLPLALYFQKIRSEKNIKAKLLMNKSAKKIAKKFKKYPPVEIKFMPKSIFTPAIFIICKNKVIINLAKEKTFFVIENKNTALSFNSYFDLMWKD